MLLFKDSIRLFAAYNEGIINLLGMWQFFFSFCTFMQVVERNKEHRQFLSVIASKLVHC